MFNKYPKFIVDYQVRERERIRQEELQYLRERYGPAHTSLSPSSLFSLGMRLHVKMSNSRAGQRKIIVVETDFFSSLSSISSLSSLSSLSSFRQSALELERMTEQRRHEEEAWYRQQQLLMEAEEQRRRVLEGEEKKLTDQRAR